MAPPNRRPHANGNTLKLEEDKITPDTKENDVGKNDSQMRKKSYLPHLWRMYKATSPDTKSTKPDTEKFTNGFPPMLPVFIEMP